MYTCTLTTGLAGTAVCLHSLTQPVHNTLHIKNEQNLNVFLLPELGLALLLLYDYDHTEICVRACGGGGGGLWRAYIFQSVTL